MNRNSVKRDNPCVHGAEVKANERGEITIPPKSYTVAVGPIDVERNTLKLSKVDKYKYKEIDGKVYRISEKGLEYPPISIEQYEAIEKLHREYFGNQKEDGGMEI